MKKYKITAYIMSAVLGCQAGFLQVPAKAEVLDQAMQGSYIEFGEYYGNPVLYKIAGSRDVDADGEEELFIYSNRIISFKSYDSAKIADWRNSTLRTWLNSNEEIVTYSDSKEPEYADQKGFLAHFTDEQLSVIVPETHKTLINNTLSYDGGSNNIGWNDTWPAVYQKATGENDIETAYHIITTDTVFIPSIADMRDYGMPLDYNMTKPDMACVNASGEPVEDNVWVRDGQDKAKPRQWYATNRISVSDANNKLGVRPCFYIKSGLEYTGSGTESDPYRLIIPKTIEGINLVGDMGPVEWSNGEFNIEIGFSSNAQEQDISVYTVMYENAQGTVKATDIKQTKCTLVPGMGTTIPISIENSENSYLKVLVFDSQNKSLCTAAVFGTEADNRSAEVSSDESFYAQEPVVEGKSISICGVEKNRSYSRVSIIVSQDDAILYADQKKIASNGSYAFDFLAEYAYEAGEKSEPGGWYDIVLSSDYSDTVITKRIGIAGNKMFEDVIGYINSGNLDIVTKIFEKDEEFLLEYQSMSGRELYIEELSKEGIAQKVAQELIADKPTEGYSAEGFKEEFNAQVTWAVFDAADTEGKYKILENEKYNEILGSKELIESNAYKAVKEGQKPDSLFEELTGETVKEKLLEKIILTVANNAQNASEMKELIEENSDKIGISFAGKYSSLSSINLKKLYDNMLGIAYSDYNAIKEKFNSSYNSVISSLNQNSGSGGGSSSGGGGGGGAGFSAVITNGNKNENKQENKQENIVKEPQTFADVKNLTWGKTEIIELTEKGIISGISDEAFAPDENITREQFCKLICEAYDINDTQYNMEFNDVVKGSWYEKYICALAKAGIIEGLSKAEFGVGKNITREDIAVIFSRVLGDKVSPDVKAVDFDDFDTISEYAKDAVLKLASSGIINGYDDNTFAAKKEVTRREAAVMLYRALNIAK